MRGSRRKRQWYPTAQFPSNASGIYLCQQQPKDKFNPSGKHHAPVLDPGGVGIARPPTKILLIFGIPSFEKHLHMQRLPQNNRIRQCTADSLSSQGTHRAHAPGQQRHAIGCSCWHSQAAGIKSRHVPLESQHKTT